MKIDVEVEKEHFLDRKWCNKSIQEAEELDRRNVLLRFADGGNVRIYRNLI